MDVLVALEKGENRASGAETDAFLPAALHALDSSRTRYLETYDDPDAFGVGAHNDVIRIALAACSQHGVPPPAVEDRVPMSDFDEDE